MTTLPNRIVWHRQDGRSLIEMALMVLIFTILVYYAVDFGYVLNQTSPLRRNF
jgi:Flp pilus assembly protein TadG